MTELLRITDINTFKGPHQSMTRVETGAPIEKAKAAMIMIHGRGASAESIIGLANEIEQRNDITFLAPKAQSNTWYPYSFLAPTVQNQPHLNSGLQAVFDAMNYALGNGIPKDKIFFLGFSQGACLASEFVARHPARYAGVFALSGGVIGDEVKPELYTGDLKQTPYFIGCSDVDSHIPLERVNESAELYKKLNADVTKVIYPDMAHTINADEMKHVNNIINAAL